MEKWKIADFVNLKCEERGIITPAVCCVSAAGCCAPPMAIKNGQNKWRFKTWGTARNILFGNLKAVMSAKNIILRNNITSCRLLNVYFSVIYLRSFYGKSVVYSLYPIAVDGPITKLNVIFFWTVINEICEICLGNREIVMTGEINTYTVFWRKCLETCSLRRKTWSWGNSIKSHFRTLVLRMCIYGNGSIRNSMTGLGTAMLNLQSNLVCCVSEYFGREMW